MKAILEFSLPEERNEWKLYEKAPRMQKALWEFREWLRSQTKHSETPPDAEEIWRSFHDILEVEGA